MFAYLGLAIFSFKVLVKPAFTVWSIVSCVCLLAYMAACLLVCLYTYLDAYLPACLPVC